MTAPSTREEAEIDRFGMFDEERFAEIVEHLDDELPCTTCDAGAEWRITLRCCGAGSLQCGKHYYVWRLAVERRLGVPHQCASCGQVTKLSFDCYRVVPL